MANFESCIRSAMNQGVLNQTEADDLVNRYQAHYAAAVAAGAPIPQTAAQAALMASVAQASAQKKAIAAGSVAATTRIRSYLETFRDLSGKANVFEGVINLIENFGAGAATSSIAGRTKAIVSLAHGDMADLLSTFRRSRLTGRRFNRPQLDNVVREVLGEATGSVEARGMADAVSTSFEKLRQDFNKAAGFEAIGKLPDGYIPQFHDPHALLRAKYPEWKAYIMPKLDLAKMRDPATGGALTPARLDEFLQVSFDHITTGGWSDREPSMMAFGKGAVANQRSDHRFIHFKTARDWLQYNKDFGRGDPIKSIFQHVNGMARDIAAMEVLGPNPNATVSWLKQVIASEAGKSRAGLTSLYKGLGEFVPADEAAKYAGWRVDAMYGFVRGRETISGKIATGFGNTRNVLTSAQLGGASILAAATDPFIDMATRYMAGLPATKALYGIAHAIRSSHTREQAVRSGMILDDFLHIVGDEARYAGTLGGSEWSKWLADRTVNLNGLEPITQARRHVFGLDFQATIADHAAHDWAALGTENAYLRRTLESYGFTPKEWNALRGTAAFAPSGGAGFIQPHDIKNRDIAKRYLEMIYGETERAVPTGTIRSRSMVTGRNPRGTWQSEILESALQYKSFALSFTTLQWQAIKQELNQGAARGAAYAGSMAVALTLGGALAMQIKNIVAGKDVQPMDVKTAQGFKFWLGALQTGGGFGILGDYMFADLTRYGANPFETLGGPTIGLVSNVLKLAIGSEEQAIQAQLDITGKKKTHIGRNIVRTAGKYVPIVSTLPYTRAAYQRMFLDQLQYLTDPEAHKYFHEQQQRLRHETGQGYWWPLGQSQPTRGPQMSTAQH